MKKRTIKNQVSELPKCNPVAKFACQFNKAAVFADKRQYRRKAKHAKQEVWPLSFSRDNRQAFCWI